MPLLSMFGESSEEEDSDKILKELRAQNLAHEKKEAEREAARKKKVEDEANAKQMLEDPMHVDPEKFVEFYLTKGMAMEKEKEKKEEKEAVVKNEPSVAPEQPVPSVSGVAGPSKDNAINSQHSVPVQDNRRASMINSQNTFPVQDNRRASMINSQNSFPVQDNRRASMINSQNSFPVQDNRRASSSEISEINSQPITNGTSNDEGKGPVWLTPPSNLWNLPSKKVSTAVASTASLNCNSAVKMGGVDLMSTEAILLIRKKDDSEQKKLKTLEEKFRERQERDRQLGQSPMVLGKFSSKKMSQASMKTSDPSVLEAEAVESKETKGSTSLSTEENGTEVTKSVETTDDPVLERWKTGKDELAFLYEDQPEKEASPPPVKKTTYRVTEIMDSIHSASSLVGPKKNDSKIASNQRKCGSAPEAVKSDDVSNRCKNDGGISTQVMEIGKPADPVEDTSTFQSNVPPESKPISVPSWLQSVENSPEIQPPQPLKIRSSDSQPDSVEGYKTDQQQYRQKQMNEDTLVIPLNASYNDHSDDMDSSNSASAFKVSSESAIERPPEKKKPLYMMSNEEIAKLEAKTKKPVHMMTNEAIAKLEAKQTPKTEEKSAIERPAEKKKPLYMMTNEEIAKLEAKAKKPLHMMTKDEIAKLEGQEAPKNEEKSAIKIPPVKMKPLYMMTNEEIAKLEAKAKKPLHMMTKDELAELEAQEAPKDEEKSATEKPTEKKKPEWLMSKEEKARMEAKNQPASKEELVSASEKPTQKKKPEWLLSKEEQATLEAEKQSALQNKDVSTSGEPPQKKKPEWLLSKEEKARMEAKNQPASKEELVSASEKPPQKKKPEWLLSKEEKATLEDEKQSALQNKDVSTSGEPPQRKKPEWLMSQEEKARMEAKKQLASKEELVSASEKPTQKKKPEWLLSKEEQARMEAEKQSACQNEEVSTSGEPPQRKKPEWLMSKGEKADAAKDNSAASDKQVVREIEKSQPRTRPAWLMPGDEKLGKFEEKPLMASKDDARPARLSRRHHPEPEPEPEKQNNMAQRGRDRSCVDWLKTDEEIANQKLEKSSRHDVKPDEVDRTRQKRDRNVDYLKINNETSDKRNEKPSHADKERFGDRGQHSKSVDWLASDEEIERGRVDRPSRRSTTLNWPPSAEEKNASDAKQTGNRGGRQNTFKDPRSKGRNVAGDKVRSREDVDWLQSSDEKRKSAVQERPQRDIPDWFQFTEQGAPAVNKQMLRRANKERAKIDEQITQKVDREPRRPRPQEAAKAGFGTESVFIDITQAGGKNDKPARDAAPAWLKSDKVDDESASASRPAWLQPTAVKETKTPSQAKPAWLQSDRDDNVVKYKPPRPKRPDWLKTGNEEGSKSIKTASEIRSKLVQAAQLRRDIPPNNNMAEKMVDQGGKVNTESTTRDISIGENESAMQKYARVPEESSNGVESAMQRYDSGSESPTGEATAHDYEVVAPDRYVDMPKPYEASVTQELAEIESEEACGESRFKRKELNLGLDLGQELIQKYEQNLSAYEDDGSLGSNSQYTASKEVYEEQYANNYVAVPAIDVYGYAGQESEVHMTDDSDRMDARLLQEEYGEYPSPPDEPVTMVTHPSPRKQIQICMPDPMTSPAEMDQSPEAYSPASSAGTPGTAVILCHPCESPKQSPRAQMQICIPDACEEMSETGEAKCSEESGECSDNDDYIDERIRHMKRKQGVHRRQRSRQDSTDTENESNGNKPKELMDPTRPRKKITLNAGDDALKETKSADESKANDAGKAETSPSSVAPHTKRYLAWLKLRSEIKQDPKPEKQPKKEEKSHAIPTKKAPAISPRSILKDGETHIDVKAQGNLVKASSERKVHFNRKVHKRVVPRVDPEHGQSHLTNGKDSRTKEVAAPVSYTPPDDVYYSYDSDDCSDTKTGGYISESDDESVFLKISQFKPPTVDGYDEQDTSCDAQVNTYTQSVSTSGVDSPIKMNAPAQAKVKEAKSIVEGYDEWEERICKNLSFKLDLPRDSESEMSNGLYKDRGHRRSSSVDSSFMKTTGTTDTYKHQSSVLRNTDPRVHTSAIGDYLAKDQRSSGHGRQSRDNGATASKPQKPKERVQSYEDWAERVGDEYLLKIPLSSDSEKDIPSHQGKSSSAKGALQQTNDSACQTVPAVVPPVPASPYQFLQPNVAPFLIIENPYRMPTQFDMPPLIQNPYQYMPTGNVLPYPNVPPRYPPGCNGFAPPVFTPGNLPYPPPGNLLYPPPGNLLYPPPGNLLYPPPGDLLYPPAHHMPHHQAPVENQIPVQHPVASQIPKNTPQYGPTPGVQQGQQPPFLGQNASVYATPQSGPQVQPQAQYSPPQSLAQQQYSAHQSVAPGSNVGQYQNVAPGFNTVPIPAAPQNVGPSQNIAPGFNAVPTPPAPQNVGPSQNIAPGFNAVPTPPAPQSVGPSQNIAPGFNAVPTPPAPQNVGAYQNAAPGFQTAPSSAVPQNVGSVRNGPPQSQSASPSSETVNSMGGVTYNIAASPNQSGTQPPISIYYGRDIHITPSGIVTEDTKVAQTPATQCTANNPVPQAQQNASPSLNYDCKSSFLSDHYSSILGSLKNIDSVVARETTRHEPQPSPRSSEGNSRSQVNSSSSSSLGQQVGDVVRGVIKGITGDKQENERSDDSHNVTVNLHMHAAGESGHTSCAQSRSSDARNASFSSDSGFYDEVPRQNRGEFLSYVYGNNNNNLTSQNRSMTPNTPYLREITPAPSVDRSLASSVRAGLCDFMNILDQHNERVSKLTTNIKSTLKSQVADSRGKRDGLKKFNELDVASDDDVSPAWRHPPSRFQVRRPRR